MALETMLDSVVMATAVRGDDGQIVDLVVDYINPVAEIGQRPAEQIVGRRFLDVWPSITESPIWGMYLHTVETGEPIVLDNFVYRDVIDGHAVSAAFDIRATRLGDGFLQNFRDVTDRYRTQQDLAASEKRFRSALDALMDPFFVLGPVRDGQGQIVDLEYRYVNQATERLYQMPSQDIIGHGLLELFPSVRELGLWDGYVESIETGTPARIDIPYFNEYGVAGSFELAVTPGDEGLIIAAREVSEAKRAHEALRASEERFRTSVEALQDGFAVFSAIHDSTGAIADFRYEYINGAGCRMEQRSRETTVGHTLAELFPSWVTSGLLAAYARVAETGEPLAREVVGYEDADGGRRVARAFDIRVVKLGDGVVASWRDVAERRRAEETMTSQAAQLRCNAAELEDRVQQRTADLLRSNQELAGFSYSVAHDLRTPLRGISGFAEALADDYGDRLDETGREYAGRVQAGCARMAALIDDLLHLSQVTQAKINLQDVDLSAEVTAICDQLRARDPGRQVTVRVQDGVRVTADRTLIRSVLDNLLENAWKFTARRDGAAIEFATAPVGDAPICCYVRDNGAGFDPAYTGKLFQPFQRLHDAGEFPGTGIGLASVRRIIERHGGRTWAEGTVGGGATIYFTLNTAGTHE
ncbi:MAG: PAS domain-containing protein [Streptosporangiaceae bacterium]